MKFKKLKKEKWLIRTCKEENTEKLRSRESYTADYFYISVHSQCTRVYSRGVCLINWFLSNFDTGKSTNIIAACLLCLHGQQINVAI